MRTSRRTHCVMNSFNKPESSVGFLRPDLSDTHSAMTTIELRMRDRAEAKDDPASLRVLLLEDSPLIADQVFELLEDSPCTTPIGIVATEGEAIAFNSEHEPDLMTLDLHLKQGTGFGVLRALSHSTKRPIVIVLTNYALPQYREQALSLGAH